MNALPGGAVTFLLTDIEGSTALWEKFPDDMERSLARHDEIMTRVITERDGFVIKQRGEGDSVFAVFARPTAAVVAALELQRNVQREPWSVPQPLRVRIAVHTGEAEQRGGDYFGRTVNRCARLRSVAHGGQTLLSATTVNLARAESPEDLSFRDLGSHRLRDLTEPEHVYQLEHPDLPGTFPPLMSLDARRHNLPVQSVPLVGRERELVEVRTRLLDQATRLLTLIGPGGIGKTRLSLHAVADLADDFPDGVFFVGLAEVADASLVAPAMAHAIGVGESPNTAILESLTDFLGDKELLLLLDNFEHVLPAASDIAEVLARCPKTKIVVTSRAVLQLSGEHVYPVSTLALPPEDSQPPVEDLLAYDAIRLFVDRAQAIKADFSLTPDNAEAVVAICRRFDGLPLAIELAAARVRLLPPQAMARRLDSALSLLTGGARDLPTRQQTLRSTIGWSYDLLSEPEQILFRRLSVFAGGCSLEAIEALVDRETSPASLDLLDGIAALLNASLLDQRETPEGEPRFWMLETIREYGQEQLATHGEEDAIRRLHAEYFLDLAETVVPAFLRHSEPGWLQRIQVDHANLRAARAYFRTAGDGERFQHLSSVLMWFWFGAGYWTEFQRVEEAITFGPERSVWRAVAFYGAAMGRRALGDRAQARVWFEDGISLAKDLGDPTITVRIIHGLGLLHQDNDDRAAARKTFEEGLAIAREAGEETGRAAIIRELGVLAWQDGDFETARAMLQESVEIHRRRNEQWALAYALNRFGDVLRFAGDYEQAEVNYRESLGLFTALGVREGLPGALHNLGYVALNQGNVEQARHLFSDALEKFQELGDPRGIAECIIGLAGVRVAAGECQRAAWLFGAAHTLLDSSDAQISSSNVHEFERNRDAAVQALGADAYASAFESGREASLDQVIATGIGSDIIGGG
jgi:predicted ATPase/class 3 adenylate cyclase